MSNTGRTRHLLGLELIDFLMRSFVLELWREKENETVEG